MLLSVAVNLIDSIWLTLEQLKGLAVPTSSAVGEPGVTYSQPLSEGPPNPQIQLPAGGVMRWILFTEKFVSVWAFAGTAGVPLALLSCPGKVICTLTCASILIICFSAGICIL